MKRTKFPHWLWHYTGASENLFSLSKSELEWFTLIVKEMR